MGSGIVMVVVSSPTTVHFGRPTTAQSEAFTRVLQGHVSSDYFHRSCIFQTSLTNLQIAIDSAVFPEGTTGAQLDVLARRALWKDGRVGFIE